MVFNYFIAKGFADSDNINKKEINKVENKFRLKTRYNTIY